MTATTITDRTTRPPRTARRRASRSRPEGVVHDTWVIARRGLMHMKRQPEALSDATIQPIMFVLLFALRVRRRHRRARRRQLPGVPDGRDLRPDHRVHGLRRGHGASPTTARTRRSTASAPCPSPGARSSAATPWPTCSSRCCPSCSCRCAAWSSAGASTAASSTRSSATLLHAGLRLRHDLGRRPARQRGRHARRASPASRFVVLFPITFMASTFVPTDSMPAAAADDRRVEPGDDPRRRHAGPVRQPQHARRPRRPLVDRPPGRLHADLGRRHRRRVRPARGPGLQPLGLALTTRWSHVSVYERAG